MRDKTTSFFSNIVLFLVLFLLCFLFLLIDFNQPLNIYDEGIVVYGAYRVLNGEIPYRDFWTLYAPGQFYIIAGLFKIFGSSILVERLWDTFVRSVLSLIVFLIVRKLTSQNMAFISWFTVVIWLSYPVGDYGLAVFPALLLSLISVWFLIGFLSQNQKSIWLVASGMSVGIATLFRHDFGFYTFIGEILWMVVLSFFWFRSTDQSKLYKTMKLIFPYSLGVLATLSLPTLYFMINVSLHELAYNLVIFPLTIYPLVRSFPYPTPLPNPLPVFTGDLSPFLYMRLILDKIPFYFPLLMYLLAVIIVLARIRKGYLVDKNICGIMLLVLIGLTFFNYARIRGGFLPVFLFALILIFPVLWEYSILMALKSRIINKVLVFLGAFLYISILIQPIWSIIHRIYVNISPSFVPLFTISHGIERASQIYIHPEHVKAVKYIQNHVPRGELIYVGNSRHDNIFVNDVMFYFLAERKSATKYHELHPGNATTLSVQQEIVEDLEQNKVRYIILVSGLESKEPNESSRSSGIRLLDDFIRNNYHVIQHFGNYSIWKKQ